MVNETLRQKLFRLLNETSFVSVFLQVSTSFFVCLVFSRRRIEAMEMTETIWKGFPFFFFSLSSLISPCGHIFPWKGMITEGWKLKTVRRSNIRPIITYKNWIWYRHSKTGYNYTIETDWGRVNFTTDGRASPFNLRDIQRQMYPDEIFLEADTCFKHVVCSAWCSEPWT